MERSFLPRALPCSHLHPTQGNLKVKHTVAWVHHSAQQHQVSGANVPSALSPHGCTGTHTGQAGRSEYFRACQTSGISHPSPAAVPEEG